MPLPDQSDLRCDVPPDGWWCSRERGHAGPCAARPIQAADDGPVSWAAMFEHDDGDALTELRDALDDAIRRAYCEPIIAPVDGEDPDEVRAMAKAAIISSPSRMRHLAGIQAAAWATVQERVESAASDEERQS